MPVADRRPPITAGQMYYVHDRLHDPARMVVAEKLVPCGKTQVWVVRDGQGHKFVCAETHLAELPADEVYRELRASG